MKDTIRDALKEQLGNAPESEVKYLYNCILARAGLPEYFLEWVKRNRFIHSGAYQIYDLIFF